MYYKFNKNKCIDKINIIFFLLCFLLITTGLYSQAGMKFPELEKRLEPYFEHDLIEDIRKQLPIGADYTIWGWDVGDFSGDGFNDVALSLRLSGDKRNQVYVYFFVDINGYLTKVAQFPYKFVEMPLEIGVVIRDNSVYITEKKQQFDWRIFGYQFINGCFVKLDEYKTYRVDNLTRQQYSNYQTLRNTDKYILTKDGNKKFFSDYMTIPCYPREKLICFGYSANVESNYVDYVTKGAYYWKGADDASMVINSAYDNEFLYFSIYVKDDIVTPQTNDSGTSDFIDIWFDVNPIPEKGDRFTYFEKERINFRNNIDSGIYKFSFYLGDFIDTQSSVDTYKKVSSTDDLKTFQKIAVSKIKSVASPIDSGYVLKFKIPFLVLGFDTLNLSENQFLEFGCTVVLHDIDNEFRPEEETLIASSAFSESNPSTFGSFIIIPADKWYGDAINIYKDDIIKALQENGF